MVLVFMTIIILKKTSLFSYLHFVYFIIQQKKQLPINLVNVYALYIWSQTQIFFSGYITISDVTPQSTILCFTNTSIEHFLLLNHLLLICKCYPYKARDSQNLSFLAFKNNIIKIKFPEERISEQKKFLKKRKIINTDLSGSNF